MSALPTPGIPQHQQDAAATVLADAFASDPMFVTTLRDPVRRRAGLPLLFRAMARQTNAYGLLDADPEGRGYALWIDPAHNDVSVAEVLRYGYLRFGFAGGVLDALRLMRVQDDIAGHHARLMAGEPHGYLFAIGVASSAQGQGVGSGLLRRGCERLDELGVAGYLETNLPQNVRLYERHGFAVARRDDDHGFPTWYMVRPRQ